MSFSAKALLTHLGIRLGCVVRDPVALLVLLTSAAATLIFWPTGSWTQSAAGGSSYFLVPFVLWLYLWPALPAVYGAGRATGVGDIGFSSRGLPALPVGMGSRALAEALLVVLAVFCVRLPLGITLGIGTPSELLIETLLGVLVMLPSLVAWTLPATSIHLYLARPLIASVLMTLAAVTGTLTSTPGLVAAVTALVVVTLCTATWEPRLSKHRSGPARSAACWRPARPGEEQLARDTWLLPARRFGPWIGAGIVLVMIEVALEQSLAIPTLVVLLTAEVPLILLLIAALRPLDSPLIIAPLAGRWGLRSGDYMRALSQLPVRAEAVLRWAWLHAMTLTLTAWVLAMLLVLIRARIHTGAFALSDAGGASLCPILLPLLGVVPCMPALTLALAVGHRLHTALSGIALLLIFHGHVMVLAVASSLLPRGSQAPLWIDAAFVVVLALVGGLPPLIHLKRRRVFS
jgi:hypothetical protein